MSLTIGTMSINIHVNFTNYGSALQTWALHQAIKRIGHSIGKEYKPLLIDYCPACLSGKDPLNPLEYMWDADEESRRNCELSLPAIRENAAKFDAFYSEKMNRSRGSYSPANFESIREKDGVEVFVCGSDTIFCPDEFNGFEDGYYANFPCMKGRSVAYAPSFGDPYFRTEDYEILDSRLSNFLAIGLREDLMVPYVRTRTDVPVRRVVDPTLLLDVDDYESIVAPIQEDGDYLLLYSRRYNPEMEAYAERLAAERGWSIVEISLRATNASRHRMAYDAGVEEFLSLVKHAKFLVTNSFHGMIFGYHFRTPFYVFSREQANSKISECLALLGLSDRLVMADGKVEYDPEDVDWEFATESVRSMRDDSWEFLKTELCLISERANHSR